MALMLEAQLLPAGQVKDMDREGVAAAEPAGMQTFDLGPLSSGSGKDGAKPSGHSGVHISKPAGERVPSGQGVQLPSFLLSSPLPAAPPMPLYEPAAQGWHMGTLDPARLTAAWPGPQ